MTETEHRESRADSRRQQVRADSRRQGADMTRVAIFDLDGTLVDSPQAIMRTFAAAFEAMGVGPRDPAEIRATIGLPLDQAFADLLGVRRDDPRVAEGMARYQEAFRTVLLPRAAELVFPGVPEGLAELRRQGITLAVATSKFHAGADALLRAAGLGDFFTVLVGADDVAHPKPHPESALTVLVRCAAGPERAVAVGDTSHDLLMARAAGIRSVAVTYGVHTRSALAAADPSYIADSFEEVVAHLVKELPPDGRLRTTSSAVVDRLLADRSRHIEFNGHLTDHIKHAVVALAGLGVDPRRIEEYHDAYVSMTSYGFRVEPARPARRTIDDDNWLELLGRRTDFAAYCDFFDRRERELGLPEVLRRYMPHLLSGWVGALTHATIHLGWGLDAGSRRMTVEGLAYLAFGHVSCHPERTFPAVHGEKSPLDSWMRIVAFWEDNREELSDWVEKLVGDTSPEAMAGINPEILRSGIQYRIARMHAVGHPLIHEIPSWATDQDPTTSWNEVTRLVTLLYLAEPGDFLLVHLITSLHAMRHIADALPADRRHEVVGCHWTGLIGVLFSRGRFPRQRKVAALAALFDTALDDLDDPRWTREWDWLIARAVEEDEEHNPKLVYVMHEMWCLSGGLSLYRVAAGQFTTRPALPATFEEPPTDEEA
ncbi:HAD-IA family hydrolase [Streptomyces sp. NPDC047072]|uniref:HAD-IA family hydrolase n=1 Tax=Streptomyces sp. NPDC047072 TaxID=3154809 RepID=UPI0033E1D727